MKHVPGSGFDHMIVELIPHPAMEHENAMAGFAPVGAGFAGGTFLIAKRDAETRNSLTNLEAAAMGGQGMVFGAKQVWAVGHGMRLTGLRLTATENARIGCCMRSIDSWTAFLVMLFLVVGLCGLFASYATSIPLERGMARSALLDQVIVDAAAPDASARMEQLRPQLDSLAPAVLDGTGPLADRVKAARAVVEDEQRREEASLGYRVRLMLGVVTTLAAILGAGILGLARRTTPEASAGNDLSGN